MPIYAPDDTDRQLEELAERERDAWTAYRDELRGLVGRHYDDAEEEAWEELQDVLRELSQRRTRLMLPLAPPRS